MKRAEITILGSGGFFADTKQGHANLLLKTGEGRLVLLDCGFLIPSMLKAQNVQLTDIDTIYVSHLHGDHSAGLEWAGFGSYFFGNKRPSLVCHNSIMQRIWYDNLECKMGLLNHKATTLETYFKPKTVLKKFKIDDINFTVIPGIHVFGEHCEDNMFSYGLTIEIAGTKFYWTSDVNSAVLPLSDQENDDWDHDETMEAVFKAYQEANVIIQDCDTTNSTDVHAHYDKLKLLPIDIKEKMHLIHYYCENISGDSDYVGQYDFETMRSQASKDGFAGLATTADTFAVEY